MRFRGSVKVGQGRDRAGEWVLPSQRLSISKLSFIYNLALSPLLRTQSQPQAPAKGTGGVETQPNLDGPKGAQATHGNKLIPPFE